MSVLVHDLIASAFFGLGVVATVGVMVDRHRYVKRARRLHGAWRRG